VDIALLNPPRGSRLHLLLVHVSQRLHIKVSMSLDTSAITQYMGSCCSSAICLKNRQFEQTTFIQRPACRGKDSHTQSYPQKMWTERFCADKHIGNFLSFPKRGGLNASGEEYLVGLRRSTVMESSTVC